MVLENYLYTCPPMYSYRSMSDLLWAVVQVLEKTVNIIAHARQQEEMLFIQKKQDVVMKQCGCGWL